VTCHALFSQRKRGEIITYALLKQRIQEAAVFFKQIDKRIPIRIISNYDADGISACAVLVKLMEVENRTYSTTILQQLTEKIVDGFAAEQYTHYIFADLGSKHLKMMHEKMRQKRIIVLDHHELPVKKEYENIMLVSPHLYDLDGGREISASGVSFFFSIAVNEKVRCMAPIAIVGAIGDIQENNGFLPLNKEILDMATQQELITIKRGLRCFGTNTRPVHKILEYSNDPVIPGVSGSESAAINFLLQHGINPQDEEGVWKTLNDLTEEERARLIAAITMTRASHEDPEDILGFQYVLCKEKEPTFRDAKEFATLLNACGRLNKASLGIGACLANEKTQKKALALMQDYRKEIAGSIRWFKEQRGKNGHIIEDNGFIIINAKDHIRSSIIGTLASMLARSGEITQGTLILSMAQTDSDITKVSLRMVGENGKVELHKIVQAIVEKVGGEAGGHMQAAGAMIPTEKEQDFIEAAKEVMGNSAALIGQHAMVDAKNN